MVLKASSQNEIDAAFAAYASSTAGALMITGDALFLVEQARIIAYAERNAAPAIYSYHESAEAGGLVSYGTSIADFYRLIGSYTGRILAGSKPAELPVQRATRIYLAINLKTAKTLGFTVPQALFARADEIIE